jgi:hypothetical protein
MRSFLSMMLRRTAAGKLICTTLSRASHHGSVTLRLHSPTLWQPDYLPILKHLNSGSWCRGGEDTSRLNVKLHKFFSYFLQTLSQKIYCIIWPTKFLYWYAVIIILFNSRNIATLLKFYWCYYVFFQKDDAII